MIHATSHPNAIKSRKKMGEYSAKNPIGFSFSSGILITLQTASMAITNPEIMKIPRHIQSEPDPAEEQPDAEYTGNGSGPAYFAESQPKAENYRKYSRYEHI